MGVPSKSPSNAKNHAPWEGGGRKEKKKKEKEEEKKPHCVSLPSSDCQRGDRDDSMWGERGKRRGGEGAGGGQEKKKGLFPRSKSSVYLLEAKN